MDLAKQRLINERKNWRKNHPPGFIAKPMTEDDCPNLKKWVCFIPGVKGSDWEEGLYKLMMDFPDDYPSSPPKCQFEKGFYHPNVYPSGTVCHSILDPDQNWKVEFSIETILKAI